MPEHKDLKDTDFKPQQIAAMVHVGSMMGDPTDNEFDQEVQRHMRENDEHEANYKKMRAAEQGGDLGPGQFENQQVEQGQALGQQQTTQGAAQAQQAQGAQMPVNAPVEAPGPVGESAPYPAQKKQPPPPGPNQGPPRR
jgi:hypothetical protein